MKIIKKPWFIPIVLTILILIIGSYYTKQLIFKAETLPEDEIRKQLEEMYGGKVDRLSLKGLMYEAELSRHDAVYLAEVDAGTGEVLSLFQTKETTKQKKPIASEEINEVESVVEPEKETVHPRTEITPETTPSEKGTGTVLISKKQAIDIALGQLKGEVDDVDFIQTSDGGYYLVEIELNDKTDQRGDEAVFQIHAISGKVHSVTWDD